MSIKTFGYSPQFTARLSGFLYLLIIIFGIFAELFVRSELIVANDPLSTANNIAASEQLFRLGFISDLIMSLCFLFLVLTLYQLLNSVNKNAARIMAVLVIVCVPILCLNMLNQFAAIRLLNGGDYLSVFTTDQINAFVLFFLKLHGFFYRA